MEDYPQKQGLYSPEFEHDACGIGAIANIKGVKSHQIIKDALDILVHLEHRGGTGADDNVGDGAGILIQIPHKFFKKQYLGFSIKDEGDYAIAQLFLSQNEDSRQKGFDLIEKVFKEQNLKILGYRHVPVNKANIGKTALDAMPYMVQVFVERPDNVSKGIEFERMCYIARRLTEKKCQDISHMYFCSFSSRTIVYKGMLLSTQVEDFYLDLKNLDSESAIALVHSRFSTNTFPSWERAHPNRYMIHNGEINTIRGNVDSVASREGLFKSPIFKDNLADILPVIDKPSSDSAMFDNTLEFLMMNGRTLEETIMMMIPEPWTKNQEMDIERRNFYEYNSMMMEPWDGPAAIIFTDGVKLGASLDRNGLRPSRYYLTKDDRLILFSETGALEIDDSIVLEKRRLEPGKLLLVDTEKGKVVSDEEIKNFYSRQKPYGLWLKNLVKIQDLSNQEIELTKMSKEDLLLHEHIFGYTYDEVNLGILPMASKKEETLVAMGDDTPLAVLSKRSQPLYNYFKQLFAQVTNPPIDAIRESIITSSRMYLGAETNMLIPTSDNAHRVKVNSPILSPSEFAKIQNLSTSGFKVQKFDITFDYQKETIEERLEELFRLVDEAIEKQTSIIILSDRNVSINKAPIPALLATSALHHHLINTSRRTHASLVIETGDAREIHHYACLLGYGATVIYPYLVYREINNLIETKLLDKNLEEAIDNYIKASNKGIIKIISKMGISTIQSYNGAQIFEDLGISSSVIDKYFTHTQTSIGGIGLEDIAKETILLHKNAYLFKTKILESEGLHGYRANKEEHLYDPLVIYHLQSATRNNDYREFKEYTKLLSLKKVNLRDLMELDFSNEISIDLVEPVDEIVKRFKTGAMSYGSISEEAHKCMAIAMNRLGGKSNTGEGGENKERYAKKENGDNESSAIKQVASGRFGVTILYLTNAIEIQIKMAQGAKPGEGGQLPGAKVYPWIANARHSTPGVALISPPPHHDIYSIEDLAQLIYDLKNANRDARISVKLVSEAGIGTVASGVAKAGSNVICISGYDGGTGASPRTSIKNAGMPWEIGLAEAHQTLVMNNLRERVRLETDGKLMTGRDLAVAALLGAEEYGFATAPLITMGCIMMRVCNLDTCPVGVATQNECLRKRFSGKPEYVINFMRFIAQEFREYMAKLGFRTVDEMIGRTDRIKAKAQGTKLDFTKILFNPAVPNTKAICFKEYKKEEFNHSMDLNVLLPFCEDALKEKKPINVSLNISNVNRTLGTILSSEITKLYGEEGLKEDTVILKAQGNAGNSFGSFLTKGITLNVVGDANDYLGKGLCGGKIIVTPNSKFLSPHEENIIVGNVTLYGATSGEIYLDGIAGERFGVRNSGATATVLGVGDHALEYMTGGKVLILGNVGKNLAAGMSGGVAYIYGIENKRRVNTQLVEIKELNKEDEMAVLDMIEKHIEYTNSCYVKKIKESFDAKQFFKIIPTYYEHMLELIDKFNGSKLDAFKFAMKEGK